MGELKFGPARVPSQESPEAAVEILLQRGYSACEIDFEGRFWMDYDFATRLGELAREHDIALSVHAPIAGFMGHAERGKKLNMAVGMLHHSAGIAKAAGAEVGVFHPGFLLGRTRGQALDLAHIHATWDGAFTGVGPFAEVLASADAVMPPGAPFHVHFSDIQFANRN